MPNGYHGSKDEWERMQAPFLLIEQILTEFVEKNGMTLSMNYHNWPERSLKWTHDDLEKLIQIYIEDEKKLTFNFWLCASQDRERKRFWKNVFLKKNVPFLEIKNNITGLLEEGKQILDSWKDTDLDFATNLRDL